MKSMKRSLIFWTIIFEKLAMALFVGIAVYIVMMSMMGSFSIEEARNLMGFMALLFSVMIITNGYSGMVNYFPMSISMGTTRKTSFIAMQIMQHFMVVQFLVLGGIAYYVVDKAQFGRLMEVGISILGGTMILLALSNLVCSISSKFGIGVGTAWYVIALLVGIVVPILFVVLAQSDGEIIFERFRKFLTKPYLFIGGILADIIAIGSYYRIIKKQDLLF